ncbi:MAG: translation initiation factor IF-2 [Candidatus Neomarinimicrobiota bacterium]|nr:translation initiation factor IF-2 [Candidatus Neomarinimicrobiota bacterium]
MALIRIFQIAKELNISHTDILSFLNTKGVDIKSHMSPVDDDVRNLIMSEFAKDKKLVDRFRKEQVRKEIHDTRLKEKQESQKKLQLLSLQEQRKIEKTEKIKSEKEKQKAEKDVIDVPASRDEKMVGSKSVKAIKKKYTTPKKQKLRKINLSNIQSEIGQPGPRKHSKSSKDKKEVASKSVETKVKATLAAIGTKKKKKTYKKSKSKDDLEIQHDEEIAVSIKVPEFSSVDQLSKIFEVSSSDVIEFCIELGTLATINQRLDWDVIELLANHFGYNAEKIKDVFEDIFTFEETEEDKEKATSRSPVVTVMGHVDHGKTSLLDYIRNTKVAAGESGGITQHIGAYKVKVKENKFITFLDTPGHEAFTAMRARGAQVTDIVILIVAADDAVMPQTKEAISHAKAASVPIIVAINKIDKPGADPDKVRRELSENDVLVESWGGKVQAVEISALNGDGIDDLLDSLLLETEILDLKSNKECLAMGTVIDSKLDRGLGPIGTVLIQKGTLKIGDPFICNDFSGKVRSIMNEIGTRLKIAEPSDAVQLQGFESVPKAGDLLAVIDNEKDLKKIANERQKTRREIEQKKISFSLDEMSALIKEGSIKTLPIIIKGDVDGSIDALSENLVKLNNDEVEIKVIHKAVGMVTESDVLLAEASNAIIVGFNVQVSSNAKLQASQAGVDIRIYNVIYNVVDEIKLALEGLLEPDKVESILGKAIVQQQFKIPNIGFIAGSKVTEGIIQRNINARLYRDDELIIEGKIESLKRFKDDAKEVKEGLECGIGIVGAKKYKEGDLIEAYEIKEIKRTLE